MLHTTGPCQHHLLSAQGSFCLEPQFYLLAVRNLTTVVTTSRSLYSTSLDLSCLRRYAKRADFTEIGGWLLEVALALVTVSDSDVTGTMPSDTASEVAGDTYGASHVKHRNRRSTASKQMHRRVLGLQDV